MRKYFSEDEQSCPCCGVNGLKPSFIKRLNQLRHNVGFALLMSSGYRCRNHNSDIGGAEDSSHILGRGGDLVVSRHKAFRVLEEAPKLGFTGIGLHQKGETNERIIHLDDLTNEPGRPRPTIWTY